MIELVTTLPETYDNPMLDMSVGTAPDELSREIDFNSDMEAPMDLGNEIDDIFSESSEDDDFEDFENIDDIDI